MENYFNYFTEIEERFQQRRGSLLMLSTLDWALIETWREGGIPLEAALRGIDDAFDKHDAKRQTVGKVRKVNGLAWCSQAVMEAVEKAREASTGELAPGAIEAAESGFETDRIVAYLSDNASKLEKAKLPGVAPAAADECASRLRGLAKQPGESLEHLDRTLTVLEEKLVGALQMSAPEDELVKFREQAARELAPYRSRMQAVQIKQVQQQFLQKRLFEAYGLPRLSLFYMSHR